MSELVMVGTFGNRVEAEIAQGLLSEQGIQSIINADDCGGMLMGVSLIRKGGIKLLVTSENLLKAEEALAILHGETD